jgi:hypothetical protein
MLTTYRRRIRWLLACSVALPAVGAVAVMFQVANDRRGGAGVASYLGLSVAYTIAVFQAVVFTTHLDHDALNAGVRRAFSLAALGSAIGALAWLLAEVWYVDGRAPGAYKFNAALIVLGSVLAAVAYLLWSKEPAESRRCGSCGSASEPGAIFCSACGRPLSSV